VLSLEAPDGAPVALRKEGIAWRSDVDKKFAPGTDEVGWLL
jgi:hypothetical protein